MALAIVYNFFDKNCLNNC